MIKITSQSPEETQRLGIRIGQLLQAGDCVFLKGDLGAGKTTLTLGLSRGLGLPENEYVRSPTFTLINEYMGHTPIYHLDLYRIENSNELDQLGLDEIFSDSGVCIVEWPEKLIEARNNDQGMPEFGIHQRLEIEIKIGNENDRTFLIKPVNFLPETHPIFSLQ